MITPEQIEVPADMLEAFKAGRGHQSFGNFDPDYERGLQAALAWLANNPIIPKPDEKLPSLVYVRNNPDSYREGLVKCLQEWQSRMFLKPERRLPAAVEDLLQDENINALRNTPEANRAIIKAYEIGRRSNNV